MSVLGAIMFFLATLHASAYSAEFTQSSPNTKQLLEKTLQPFESQLSSLLQGGVVMSVSDDRVVIAQSQLWGCIGHELVIKFKHLFVGSKDHYKIIMSCNNIVIQQIDMYAYDANKKITFSEWLNFQWFQPEDGESFDYRFTSPIINMQFSRTKFDFLWTTSLSKITYFSLNYIEKEKNKFKERVYKTFHMSEGENRWIAESLKVDGIYMQNYFDKNLNQMTEDQFKFFFTDPVLKRLNSIFQP